MKKTIYIICFLVISLVGVIIVLNKEDTDNISTEPTVYPMENPSVYPNEYIWSFKNSQGILEYKNDFKSKYKILSNKGVTDTLIALYEPYFVTYNKKIEVNDVNWEYKVSYSYQEHDELNTCVIYLTETSIIIDGYEYLITGNDKISKDECLFNLFETFEWFYKQEMFGKIITKEN